MAYERTSEIIKIESLKDDSRQETLEKLVNGQDVLFSANRDPKNFNLLVLELQITKSTKRGINLSIELKRKHSQTNRSIYLS